MSKILGFVLLLAAYAMLIPGLTEPMLSVSGTVEKTKLVAVGQDILKESGEAPGWVLDVADAVIDSFRVSGTVPAFNKSNSIIGTAQELYDNNHIPVAALILMFSVGVPLFKALLLVLAHIPFRDIVRQRLLWISAMTSKWSMADVFVVAIFVAFLAGNGIREQRALVDFKSSLGPGFYYFLGYCLLSILATQLLTHSARWQASKSDALAKPQASNQSAEPTVDQLD